MRKHVGWLDGGDEQVLGPGRLQGGRLQPPDVDVQTFLLKKKIRSFFSSFQKFLPSRLKNNFSFSINSCFTRTLQFFSGSDIVGLRSSSAGNLFCFDREPDGPMCVFYISVLQK